MCSIATKHTTYRGCKKAKEPDCLCNAHITAGHVCASPKAGTAVAACPANTTVSGQQQKGTGAMGVQHHSSPLWHSASIQSVTNAQRGLPPHTRICHTLTHASADPSFQPPQVSCLHGGERPECVCMSRLCSAHCGQPSFTGNPATQQKPSHADPCGLQERTWHRQHPSCRASSGDRDTRGPS